MTRTTERKLEKPMTRTMEVCEDIIHCMCIHIHLPCTSMKLINIIIGIFVIVETISILFPELLFFINPLIPHSSSSPRLHQHPSSPSSPAHTNQQRLQIVKQRRQR